MASAFAVPTVAGMLLGGRYEAIRPLPRLAFRSEDATNRLVRFVWGGASMSATDIYNWRRLDSRITTSGQPTETELVELSSLGIGHVINLGLHTHERALPNEAESLARLGMNYIHIPVEFDRPTEQDFARFCEVLAELGGEPVHVHCIANMRVSAFLYRWQRDVLGRAEIEARQLMDTIWQPGGTWAKFIGDDAGSALPHRAPKVTIR